MEETAVLGSPVVSASLGASFRDVGADVMMYAETDGSG